MFLHRSSVKAMTDNLLYSHQCLQETCLCSTLVLVFLIKTCLVLVYAIHRERIIFGESGSTCKPGNIKMEFESMYELVNRKQHRYIEKERTDLCSPAWQKHL